MLMRTTGSCEGKDTNMRWGSAAAAAARGETGKEGRGLKCEGKRRRDRRVQAISILIDLCL